MEDPAAAGGVVLCKADAAQYAPADGVMRQQVSKQLGDVSELVGLQPVDDGILPGKTVLKHRLVATTAAAAPPPPPEQQQHKQT